MPQDPSQVFINPDADPGLVVGSSSTPYIDNVRYPTEEVAPTTIVNIVQYSLNTIGANNQVLINRNNEAAGDEELTYDANTNILTADTLSVGRINVALNANLGLPSRVKITGGSSGYVLSTDGSGNLSWISQQVANTTWSSLSGKPTFATVATSGNYNDLANIPTGMATTTYVDNLIANVTYANLSDSPVLATVATTGAYNDLSNLPSLSAVALSGNYNDLANLPSIPSISGLASELYVNNKIANVTYANLTGTPTIPTHTSNLVNDSSYALNSAIPTDIANLADATSLLGAGGIALTDLSIGAPNTASGGGSLSYANTTGIFTYTPPDVSGFLTTITNIFDQDLNKNDTVEFASVITGGNLGYSDSANLISVEDKDGFGQVLFQNKNPGANASMNIVLVNDSPGTDYMAIGINSSNFSPLYNTLFELPNAGYISHTVDTVIGPQSGHSASSSVYLTYESGAKALELNANGAIGWGANYNGTLTHANFGTSGQVLTSSGPSSAPTWTTISGGGGGIALTDISVGADNSASGGGGLSYVNTTGVFTYTPPDLSSYLTTITNIFDQELNTTNNVTFNSVITSNVHAVSGAPAVGAPTNAVGGAGSLLTISAGDGGIAATGVNAGNGGNLTITAGDAGSDIGNPSWGNIGGNLVLRGGNSSRPYHGSDVQIHSGDSVTSPGLISLHTGTNQWTFGKTGDLTLANSATIIAPADNDLTLVVTVEYNICTLLTGGSGYGGGGSSSAISGGSGTGMMVGYGYGLSGQVVNVSVTNPGTGYVDGDVLTMTAGSGATFEITRYNSAANPNTNTAPANWTFGTDGNLTLPTNTSKINYANGTSILSGLGAGGNPFDQDLNTTNSVTFANVQVDGNVALGLVSRINSGGFGVTNSAEFGTDVTLTGPTITGSEIFMGAGTAESRAIVNSDGNSLIYIGVEDPGFAGMVAIDPGVTNDYAIQVGANNHIEIGAVAGTITTTEYVVGLGVINNTGNINGIFANANVAVIGVGDIGWKFDDNGTLYLPGDDQPSKISFSEAQGAYIGQGMGEIDIRSGPGAEIQIQTDGGANYWTFGADGNLTLPQGTILSETSTTTVITPPGVFQTGQSLVIRPTGSQGITSDRPGGFTDGDTITLTVTPDYNSTPVTGTVDYTFTDCTQLQLGRALTGTLTFTSDPFKLITWTIPVSSTMTTFTITLSNASGFSIAGLSPLTLTTSGSTEDRHIHLIAGDPSITDIYLGDDDQYVKIERNGGNVLIGTDENNNQWRFDTDGDLYIPPGKTIRDAMTGDDLLNGSGTGVQSTTWVQDFETSLGAPADVPVMSTSVEYLANGDVVALFMHDVNNDSSSYSSVARFDSYGTKVWSMSFSGTLLTDGWGLAVDNNDGFIYVAGSAQAESGYKYATLTKLSEIDGDVVWSKSYDVGYNNSNMVVDVASDGNPVVVGYADNGTDAQIVTTKINSSTGAVIWSRALDGQGDEQAYGMAVGYGGEVVSVGYMAQLGEGEGEGVDTDDRMLIVKYAGDGTIAWEAAVQVEAGYDCKGADADIDGSGNIYVCGNFDYNESIDKSAMIIIKFDSAGVKQWTRKVQGDCEDFATSIVVGPDNYLYLSAVTGTNNNNDYSMVIAKYNTDGAVVWQRLLDNTTSWTFAGGLFLSTTFGGSTLAVRDGYVAVSGSFGAPDQGLPHAVVAQFDTAGTTFSVGDYDFIAATFSGVLDSAASNITVTSAGKTDSDYIAEFTTSNFSPTVDLTSDLIGTRYSSTIGTVGTVKLTAPGNRKIEEVYGYNSVSVTSRNINTQNAVASRASTTDYYIWIDTTLTTIDELIADPVNYGFEFSLNNINWYPWNGGYSITGAETGYTISTPVTYLQGDTIYCRYKTGGEPVVWWDAATLPNGDNNFRGATIDYHAYTGESTIIGTIHIVNDSGEDHISHSEVQSGSSDGENDDLWVVLNEGTVSYQRIDGESKTLKVQWTAKVFYGSEYYD